ncbi:MAG: YceI family protein [Anaerolineae bacterium]|nr:YceI family protein [Anaerolineae bacterium]
MQQNIRVLLIGAILVMVAAALLWNRFMGEPQPPSGPIEAVELTPTAQAIIFQIDPEQSSVLFTISEVLGGAPNIVIGLTSEVGGQIAVNWGELSQSQVGVIQVNARTLLTDNPNRNRAISNLILNTNQYEFITFAPTALEGLTGPVAIGQTFSFQIMGDLTIRDITQPVQFAVTAQAESETRIKGQAKASIQRSDYNLTIPTVDNVADVAERVNLVLDFVAVTGP